MLSAKPIWPRILPLPDVWLLSRGDTASGNASAMFLMKKSKKPNMKTAISQCLFRCLSFKKKPSMLTDLPKKWLLSPIPACQ